MTPQQEERLGRLMATRARQEGHIRRFPGDPPPLPANVTADDVKNIPLVYAYLKGANRPKFRFQIIHNVNAGIRSIDRCLKALDEAGKIQRTHLNDHMRWQAIK